MTSTGSEIVYRAFDRSPDSPSRMWGRFFFMPRVAGLAIEHLTADQLEVELNASLWGNRFEYLATFRLNPDVTYLLGNIAQDDYSEKDGSPDADQVFQAQSFIVPSGLFQQVFLSEPEQQATCVGSPRPIRSGRLARHRPNWKTSA